MKMLLLIPICALFRLIFCSLEALLAVAYSSCIPGYRSITFCNALIYDDVGVIFRGPLRQFFLLHACRSGMYVVQYEGCMHDVPDVLSGLHLEAQCHESGLMF